MSAQATMESMPGGKVAAAPSAVLIVYAGALLQGMTLVSFPAVSAMLKQTLTLSDADYGALFLPQVAFAIVGAIAGGALARKIGLKALFALALAANTAGTRAMLHVQLRDGIRKDGKISIVGGSAEAEGLVGSA